MTSIHCVVKCEDGEDFSSVDIDSDEMRTQNAGLDHSKRFGTCLGSEDGMLIVMHSSRIPQRYASVRHLRLSDHVLDGWYHTTVQSAGRRWAMF